MESIIYPKCDFLLGMKTYRIPLLCRIVTLLSGSIYSPFPKGLDLLDAKRNLS